MSDQWNLKVAPKEAALRDAAKTHAESVVITTELSTFRKHPELAEEVFGPFAVLVSAPAIADLEKVAREMEGQLTATVHGTAEDLAQAQNLVQVLQRKAGRLIINGFPTGVEVRLMTS